ncbi:Translation initiation factor IF-2 like [Quillaja saponaria]|uniref:Translation initiation factor IF-2 like n=1 Tax=Quillaja saponaria TaxID=32244 RepID=A0AAD7LYZ3_QUISA|nr:Translation initiation factor IF-2 like [Quillaja saponaria]
MESIVSSLPKTQQKETCCGGKETEVHEEIKRMNQLPANSTYATHRLRVLNKILKLMSTQRTAAQDEELELLFAGLSL